jgi:hypothetical protein
VTDLHAFSIDIEADCTPLLVVHCPYEMTDRTRPCWPRTEDGELDEDFPNDCNIKDWIDNIGWEIAHGERRFFLTGARIDWSNGDYPILHIDLDREHCNAVEKGLRKRIAAFGEPK